MKGFGFGKWQIYVYKGSKIKHQVWIGKGLLWNWICADSGLTAAPI